ncbi:sodium channel and clathrin linker 1 isoform X1 [Gallus gallus]|uniref:Sodium channel and clathrin linker 1 n=2 Tax=Gallus gallus TaxID=9031 RepID=A0A8V0XYE2_CHICK|nr:sodium channel and clathrin linker 1 isoform X1 [Gallus gallus]XP_046797034.1 sodium channel and clathrin linker 1 isoform X1 [Gallus gallus]
MAAELGSGGEPDQKLDVALEQDEADEVCEPRNESEENVAGGDGISRSRMMGQSLITKSVEYEKCLEEMREQLQMYQVQMSEMRQKFEQVTTENRRLHAELKEALEMHLDALPFTPLGTAIPADEEILRNLQEQLQLTNQEKEQAIELWQTVSQELDQLQQQYQEHMTRTQIHMAERLKQQDQLANFHQLTSQLHAANEKTELSSQFLKTVAEQNVELEQLQKELRQAKIDRWTASAKVDEMIRLTKTLQGQLERKEEDVVSAQQREAASDKLLQQMQSSIKQLETRLHVTVQDAEQLRTERTALEKQIRMLQTKCAHLEREKYEAVAKVQDCVQLLEEANLQKSQALFKKKQKEEEIKKMKDEIFQLTEDTAARIRKAVDSAKKQYNVQISQLTEELLALHMECGEKQGQIERAIREKRAVEEELEKICREYGGHESDNRKLEQLHQKYLLAETTKCDLQLSLQTTQHKLKLLEMNFEEEKSNYQKNICNLQSILDSEREKSGSIGEQRLKLQQENEQLQKEIESLRKLATEAQQKAKIKISTMEHEHAVKEHGYEVRLKEMEDMSQKSTAELRHLLVAQQKATNRWKEETKVLTETTEARINKLKSDLSQHKLRNQELIAQLEMANNKVIEDEKLMTEYQKHINRLQVRLSQAEQRAATASQKLSTLTTWKKKASSLKELENI